MNKTFVQYLKEKDKKEKNLHTAELNMVNKVLKVKCAK